MARGNREQRLTTETQVVELLRQRRKARGLSQQQLASKLGVAQARLSDLEAGRARLTLARFIAIAQLLDLDVVLRVRSVKSAPAEW